MRSIKSPLRIIWCPILLLIGLLAAPVFERAVVAAGPQLERVVTIHDACDPVSFNAAVGPGTCTRNGGVLFGDFIAFLTAHQSIGGWHFGPSQTAAKVGDTFVAVNQGGETHTFTEVDDFGGGIVPPLNVLSGNPVPAPECLALEDDDFVAPGQKYRETLDEAGTKKFQCCIHPWMRLEASVR